MASREGKREKDGERKRERHIKRKKDNGKMGKEMKLIRDMDEEK